MTSEYKEVMQDAFNAKQEAVAKEQKANEAEQEAIATEEFSEESVGSMELIPGKKYQGSFWINSFGEVHVRPRQEGSNPQGQNTEFSGDNWIVYSFKNCIRCVVTLPRDERSAMLSKFMNACSAASAEIFQHEWRRPSKPPVKGGCGGRRTTH